MVESFMDLLQLCLVALHGRTVVPTSHVTFSKKLAACDVILVICQLVVCHLSSDADLEWCSIVRNGLQKRKDLVRL